MEWYAKKCDDKSDTKLFDSRQINIQGVKRQWRKTEFVPSQLEKVLE